MEGAKLYIFPVMDRVLVTTGGEDYIQCSRLNCEKCHHSYMKFRGNMACMHARSTCNATRWPLTFYAHSDTHLNVQLTSEMEGKHNHLGRVIQDCSFNMFNIFRAV